MAYAYVRTGRETQFEDYVRRQLADRVQLFRSAEVLSQGWLGPGEPHLALRDWLKGEERHTHIGVHSGLSAAEMTVPLVVAPLP